MAQNLHGQRLSGPPPVADPAGAEHLPTRDGYDRWAAIYDDEDNPLIRLEAPVVHELTGPVAGLDVLDLGCGTGRWSLKWAERGANVTGVDFSEGMLAKARHKPGAGRIRFEAHDLTAPLPFADGAFDLISCCLVLEHLPDLEPVFREMRRLCRRAGAIVISDMHPAMMLLGIQARFTDPKTGRETRPASAPHRISDYVMAATRAGLRFEHLSEHAVDEALAAASPRGRKYLGWPMLVAMKLRPI